MAGWGGLAGLQPRPDRRAFYHPVPRVATASGRPATQVMPGGAGGHPYSGRWPRALLMVLRKCGISHPMKATIDADGRLVIPEKIRRQAGLRLGMSLEVRWQDGRIEIEPAAASVKLVRRGRLLVAVPETAIEELSAETVEETRRALRRERGSET